MVDSTPSVDTSYRDAACVITLNRPERYNAITIPMMQELSAALAEADTDERAACVIVTATGRGFCAGQDLNVLAEFYGEHDPAELGGILRNHYNDVTARIWGLGKPVIAAVQGTAAGAGWSLAVACDLRIAARSARFVPAFAKLGLVPDMGGTTSLVHTVGYAKAMEFALLTDALSADEALAWGLVNRVVSDGDLMATAYDYARHISALPPEGVRLTKQALRAALVTEPARQLHTEAWLQALAASSAEHAKRVLAFAAQKR